MKDYATQCISAVFFITALPILLHMMIDGENAKNKQNNLYSCS